jgi:hypothetical protein
MIVRSTTASDDPYCVNADEVSRYGRRFDRVVHHLPRCTAACVHAVCTDTLDAMRRILSFAVTLSWVAFPATAQTNPNLCAFLPEAEVSGVVGTPVKLTAGTVETNKTGAGTLRTQMCNYNPPGGIGSGPTTVRVTISEASSATMAAQLFKAESETLRPMVAGKAEPLSGVGDEAVAFPKPGSVYMRKKNVTVDISVGRRDLDLGKEVALGKQLAQRAAARIQ